jgi:hypothetical protein
MKLPGNQTVSENTYAFGAGRSPVKTILSKIVVIVFVAQICGIVLADMAQTKDQFITPPDSARPHTWWHWMNGNVTQEGITADLEAMAKVGIGGAQIFNVADKSSVNIPAGPVDYMSEEWLELVSHAVKEARRLGLEICMHNCAGWSSSGGPWITPEYAMKKVTLSETEINGPASIDLLLPVPTAEMEYYQDIAVVAFPTPKNNTYRLSDASQKAGFESAYGIDLDTTEAPSDAVVRSKTVVDISRKMSPQGQLKWDCPAGAWTVLRIGYTVTGKTNHPALGTGLGLECDKLSRQALDVHWQKGIQPILDKLGSLAGPVMNNLLVDSYEVGINNWTKNFEKEFKARRGYTLTRYLPTLTGRVVDSTDVSERFLWDYRRTISDLFTANYYGYFADKCHAAGLLCSVEPYDGPFECMSIASKADILMGEFWIGMGVNPSVRIASSLAHVYGRTIVGAESFTSMPRDGRWQNHPRSMKALGDQIWCNGINRYIFHRYAHQPWLDKWPGMTMGQWGTHFERTNTWWNDGQAWMQYIARSQFLLQAGRFHADVLFFGGEFVPQGAVWRPDLKAQGYDYDAIGTDLILKLSVRDGKLVLPSGMRYSLLVMPETETMSPAVAKKIQDLLRKGATVLAARPKRSPSLTGYPQNDRKAAKITEKIWGTETEATVDRKVGRGRILSGCSVGEGLNRMGIKPDFRVLSEDWEMNFIHRVIDGADVYFVSNQQDRAGSVRCAFRVSGRKPELWNSQKGTIVPAMLWRPQDDCTEVTLTLEPEESVFVVFNEAAEEESDRYVAIERRGGFPSRERTDTLEIIKAEYGVFSLAQCGMADVTDKLRGLIRDNRLAVTANNQIAGDPAVGVTKTLLVEYTYDGKEYTARAVETKRLQLPGDELPAGKKLVIRKAAYGNLNEQLASLPEPKTVDITDRLSARVSGGMVRVQVTNELAGGDPVLFVPKHLRVEYRFNGVSDVMMATEGQMLEIPANPWKSSPWPPQFCPEPEGVKLLVWEDGEYHLAKDDGGESVVAVQFAPEPIHLDGPWSVRFESMVPSPKPTVFNELQPLAEHEDPEVKAFSGTAVYQKTVTVANEMLAASNRLVLDLGRVEVMARVLVNGQDLGVLWKNPYRLDITKALRAGDNQLEVRVTNLWVNRIIADQAYEEDCRWDGSALAEWPQWLIEGQPRPSQQRKTFYTWKHWSEDDPLLASGLIGPVTLRVGQLQPIQ